MTKTLTKRLSIWRGANQEPSKAPPSVDSKPLWQSCDDGSRRLDRLGSLLDQINRRFSPESSPSTSAPTPTVSTT